MSSSGLLKCMLEQNTRYKATLYITKSLSLSFSLLGGMTIFLVNKLYHTYLIFGILYLHISIYIYKQTHKYIFKILNSFIVLSFFQNFGGSFYYLKLIYFNGIFGKIWEWIYPTPRYAHTTRIPYLIILFYVIGTTFYQKNFAIYKVMRACACVRVCACVTLYKKRQMKINTF